MNVIWNLVARMLAKPAVVEWLIRRAKRTPYSPIISEGLLYMERFWLFNPYPDTGASGADRPFWRLPISIRLHHIHLPDQDRHLHDHPWNARTFILRGGYEEIRPYSGRHIPAGLPAPAGELFFRKAGDTVPLRFGEYHRIVKVSDGGVWTLFVTGKHRGTWGFDVEGVKVPWRKYLGLEKSA